MLSPSSGSPRCRLSSSPALAESHTSSHPRFNPSLSLSRLSVLQVVIRRRPLFYTVSLLLPSIFLMVMDIVGFYLPPNSGERVSFKITLLLGYSVFLIIVSDTLPATAVGTPLIGTAARPTRPAATAVLGLEQQGLPLRTETAGPLGDSLRTVLCARAFARPLTALTPPQVSTLWCAWHCSLSA